MNNVMVAHNTENTFLRVEYIVRVESSPLNISQVLDYLLLVGLQYSKKQFTKRHTKRQSIMHQRSVLFYWYSRNCLPMHLFEVPPL